MVNNIQEAYMEQLQNLGWMDTITRQSAIDKLQSMHKFIAYPDWFHDPVVLRNKLKFVSKLFICIHTITKIIKFALTVSVYYSKTKTIK